MLFRVIDWKPDERYGFAVACDPFITRKIFVHEGWLIDPSQRIQIGSLIEADMIKPRPGRRRYMCGANIKVVR